MIVGLVSIVVALTFHPAVLMVLGDRVDRLRGAVAGPARRGFGRRGGPDLAARRRSPSCAVPAISLIAATALLLALASPVLGLHMGAGRDVGAARTTPSPSRGWSPWSATSRSGATDPVNIVVDGSPNDAAPSSRA